MTDPAPNPELEILLKWDGVGLPPKRTPEPDVHSIENTQNEDDEVANENEKSKNNPPPTDTNSVSDSAN